MNLQPKKFQRLILSWFDQHGRKQLPWQHNKTPYRIWISEIMLQQTQVSTVIPYFERFMQQFPTLLSLALAPEDAVLHLWAGLGYYSRARNLHRTAKLITENFAGQFPESVDKLESLPGIGKSTAGAILAIAFNKRAVILDGNVKRVLARFCAINEPINEKLGENKLWDVAAQFTPNNKVADYTQAMMDLGAMICTRAKPMCLSCPLQHDCLANLQGLTNELPRKKITRAIPTRRSTFIILQKQKNILLLKRPSSGIWGGLWSLPEITGEPDIAQIKNLCKQRFNIACGSIQMRPAFRHTFSHYHLDIHPVIVQVKQFPLKIMEADRQIWYNPEKPAAIGLPKPIQTIIREL